MEDNDSLCKDTKESGELARQKRLLRSCLPDEWDSVRVRFCMTMPCQRCLLGKKFAETYGECRNYAIDNLCNEGGDR